MPALPTLRQLAYLVELSERLNFRVAAEAQFVTQSTLSAGIKELEKLLGVQLVERDRHHVRLTTVGEDVVARGRELLAAATDLAEAARSATRPVVRAAAPRRDPHDRALSAAGGASGAAARVRGAEALPARGPHGAPARRGCARAASTSR